MYEMKEKSSFRTGERKCKGSCFSSPWLKKVLQQLLHLGFQLGRDGDEGQAEDIVADAF